MDLSVRSCYLDLTPNSCHLCTTKHVVARGENWWSDFGSHRVNQIKYLLTVHLDGNDIWVIQLFHFINPLTLLIDQDGISPYIISSVSGRQVRRIEANINLGVISWSTTKFSKLTSKELEKDVFFLSCHMGQRKNSESPWGIKLQTFEFCTLMLYLWAIQNPWWTRSIMKFIWHASCIPLGSAMSIV